MSEQQQDENKENDQAASGQQAPTDDWESSKGKGGRDAVLADLHKERETRRELEKKLQAIADKEKSESQLAMERAERAEKAVILATRKAVAAANGVPGDLVDAVKGDTEEEMTESAKLLAKYLRTPEDEKRANFLPGRRGKPVGASPTALADNWLRGLPNGPE